MTVELLKSQKNMNCLLGGQVVANAMWQSKQIWFSAKSQCLASQCIAKKKNQIR